jgi:hypothetical protein
MMLPLATKSGGLGNGNDVESLILLVRLRLTTMLKDVANHPQSMVQTTPSISSAMNGVMISPNLHVSLTLNDISKQLRNLSGTRED